MILTDTRNNCVDSGTKVVYIPSPVSNNIIDTSQIVCDTNELSNIIGKSPNGGTGSYTYKWFYRNYDSTNWHLITGANSQNQTVKKDNNSYHYLRVVKSGTCSYESNVLGKLIIKDIANIQKRDSSCSIILETVNSNSFGLPIQYQWQKSTDSINWSNITGANKRDYIVNRVSVTGYFRLKATASNCTVYSIGYKPLQEFNILTHPQDRVFCKGQIDTSTCFAVSNYGSIPSYQWQRVDPDTGGWVNLLGQQSTSLFLGSDKVFQSYSLRCKISSTCGSAYSNIAYFDTVDNGWLGYLNSDTLVTSGIPITFVGQFNSIRNSREHLKAIWQRSENPIGGIWETFDSTSTDSLTWVSNFTNCQQRNYYRYFLTSVCGSKNYSPKYSKTFEVGQYTQPAQNTDLWIPDSWEDRFGNQGAEPNWADSQNYTNSFYLWNRIPNTKYKLVKDWLERENVSCDLDTNYIHCMVYNRENTPANTGKVYFYWTVMSTNEDWPFSWTGQATRKNPGNNQFYKLGGRINKTGIDISTFLNMAPAIVPHPAYNGQLQPGDSVLITYAWTQADTVPQPSWYGATVGNGNTTRYANTVGMCLLARIQDCQTDAYGMTYPEKINKNKSSYKSPDQSNIGYNVTHNNNITSANFYLGYMTPPYYDTTQVWVLGAANQTSDSNHTQNMEFSFCVEDPIFYTNGEVQVIIDDQLWPYFNAAGKPGNGFYSVNPNEIIITDPCALIGPVAVPDSLTTLLGFNFRYKPGISQSGLPIYSLFTLKETLNDTQLTGITQMGVQSFSAGAGNNNGNLPGAAYQPIAVKNDSNTILFNVYPNPFKSELHIQYKGMANSAVRIELFDAKGAMVKIICDCYTQQNGMLEYTSQNFDLAEGIYTIKVVENGTVKTEQLLKLEK